MKLILILLRKNDVLDENLHHIIICIYCMNCKDVGIVILGHSVMVDFTKSTKVIFRLLFLLYRRNLMMSNFLVTAITLQYD